MFQYTDGLIVAENIVRDSRGNAICLLANNQNFLVTNNVVRSVLSGVAGAAGINGIGAGTGQADFVPITISWGPTSAGFWCIGGHRSVRFQTLASRALGERSTPKLFERPGSSRTARAE
jgi:hypothetical protein